MRSHHSVSGPAHRRSLDLPSMPLEWLDTGTWRLPSGKALAEFALQAGFLAPMLLRSERSPNREQVDESSQHGTPEALLIKSEPREGRR